MDFFASQDLARRNTRRLVGLLILTVVTIILAVYALSLALLGGLSSKSESLTEFTSSGFFSPENGLLVIGIASAVIAVVFLAP